MPRELINPCSRAGCSNKISAQNKSGICTPCQQGRSAHLTGAQPKKPRTKRRDPDDKVLSRVLDTSAVSAKTTATAVTRLVDDVMKAEAHAAVEKDETWLAKFYRLHEALGLDAERAIEDHCQEWVELTTSRALGESVVRIERPAKPARRKPAAPNGTLENIGDDYEQAREQAAAGGPA